MPETPILELRQIAKSFGPRLLFGGVSLSLECGRVYLLLGPNGAGKSTLLKIMAGLCQPDEGTASCAVLPDRLAYMGHATFIYPGLTALENLRFWAEGLGLPQPETVARKALDRVALSRWAGQRAGVFSRGMAQRLNLARLLLAQPQLLLLDEPGTGLDVDSRAFLHDIIQEARAREATTVWISHDKAVDAPWADYILEIADKRLLVADNAQGKSTDKNFDKTSGPGPAEPLC